MCGHSSYLTKTQLTLECRIVEIFTAVPYTDRRQYSFIFVENDAAYPV